jgi:hypothetical protein
MVLDFAHLQVPARRTYTNSGRFIARLSRTTMTDLIVLLCILAPEHGVRFVHVT